jgi:hypothetical protein
MIKLFIKLYLSNGLKRMEEHFHWKSVYFMPVDKTIDMKSKESTKISQL